MKRERRTEPDVLIPELADNCVLFAVPIEIADSARAVTWAAVAEGMTGPGRVLVPDDVTHVVGDHEIWHAVIVDVCDALHPRVHKARRVDNHALVTRQR